MKTEEAKEKRRVDQEELAQLGFSEEDIAAAVRMEKLGLFALEPSNDLQERTIARCLPLLPDPKSIVDPLPDLPDLNALRQTYVSILRDLSSSVRASTEWSQFSEVQGWQGACLTTLRFAQERHERPFIMLDNHNVIEPKWWGSDTGFRSFWNASQVVNKIAAESGLPRAACFVVLRPEPHDYSENDLETIDGMIRDGNSDVWWISYDRAGAYQGRDVIVLGDERVFEIQGKPESPVAAMESFHEQVQQKLARGHRTQIQLFESLGKSIRVEGKLSEDAAASVGTNSGIRHLMQSVISGMSEAVIRSK